MCCRKGKLWFFFLLWVLGQQVWKMLFLFRFTLFFSFIGMGPTFRHQFAHLFVIKAFVFFLQCHGQTYGFRRIYLFLNERSWIELSVSALEFFNVFFPFLSGWIFIIIICPKFVECVWCFVTYGFKSALWKRTRTIDVILCICLSGWRKEENRG